METTNKVRGFEARLSEMSSPGRGFRMFFDNGWGISVQWAVLCQCDSGTNGSTKNSRNAEIAVFTPQNRMLDGTEARRAHRQWEGIGHGNDVIGYLNTNDVLRATNCVAAITPEATPSEAVAGFRAGFYIKEDK